MEQFFSEVAFEVRHVKPANNNLNLKALQKIEESGVEIKKYKMKSARGGAIGAARKNPLDRLYEKRFLSRQEYVAATRYQEQFELSEISHHARPSYDGTSISAASTRISERGPSQSQLEAGRYIFKIKNQLGLAVNYETDKNFKITSLKLPEILTDIFEKQIAVRRFEKRYGINHKLIEERIKLICKILLEC